MSDNELRYEKILHGFRDADKVKALYNSAFPQKERILAADELDGALDQDPYNEGYAVYDGDTMIGFFALSGDENYRLLEFLAVDPSIRNKGYGSRIIRKILEHARDTVFFGLIERPVPGTDGYEIKKRRQNFYERNGMITVDRPHTYNGVEFIVVTNKTGEDFDKCYEVSLIREKMWLK